MKNYFYCEKSSCQINQTGVCFAQKKNMPVCCSICKISKKCEFVCKKIKWANKVKKNKKFLVKEYKKSIDKLNLGYRDQFIFNEINKHL